MQISITIFFEFDVAEGTSLDALCKSALEMFCYLDFFKVMAFSLFLKEFMENFDKLKSS